MTGSPRAGGESECRKRFQSLPFEAPHAAPGEKGALNIDCRKLRVDPSDGAMTAENLQDLCTGLRGNKNVTHLDLDGNQFGLGAADEDVALEPLVALCAANTCLTTLDISNNGLCFEEGCAQVDSLEKLVLESSLTSLIIGGNMDIEEELLEKLAGWVMASERRWRNVGLGKIDEDAEEAANKLRATVRQAANAAEAAALVDFFNRPRATASRAPLQTMQSPRAAAASPAEVSSPGSKRAAESRPSPAKRQKAQPAPEQTSTPTAPATAKPAVTPVAPVAPSAPAAPPGASEERCKAFLAAFHDIREDDAQVEKDATLAQIAAQLGGGYDHAEMEYYLSCMEELNFIMVTRGVIYII